MRLSILTGFAASGAIIAASLAPVSANILHPAIVVHGPAFQSGINPHKMTRDQLGHFRATVLPRAAEQRALRYEALHHPMPFARSFNTNPTQWLTDDASYIWGLAGTAPTPTVVSTITDCSGAEGGVVDRKGRLVVACTNSRTVQVYNAGNYNGPANLVLADSTTTKGDVDTAYFPAAAFEDNNGVIYATNLFGEQNCNPSCTFVNGSITWWKVAQQTTGHIASGSYTDPNLTSNYFADADGEGDVYVDGFGPGGPEVDEIEDILKKAPTSTNLGITLNFPGGIYVTSPRTSSELLSVIDQGSFGSGNDSLRVYTIPFTGTAKYTDKPPQNLHNTCDPVAGGYDAAEAHILIGDAGCHDADLGTIATNAWTIEYNNNFVIPIEGLYLASDK